MFDFQGIHGPDVSFYQDAPTTPERIDFKKMRAAGADFVMLGRPFLWAMGAAGAPGLARFADGLAEDIGIALAQVGLRHVREIGPGILASRRG